MTVSERARLADITARISREYPVLRRGLLANQLDADDALWDWALVALDHVVRITGGDEDRLDECVESFVVTSLDFLRLQARFMKTGRYACSSAAETSALYSDGERMTEYLDGLALTYAMWPNHTRMLRYFVEDFVPSVPVDGALVEIGPGHGLLAAVLLARRDDVRYVGVDISPRSLSYSAGAFAAAGIAPDRYSLVLADATNPDGDVGGQDPFGAAVCCEVLEHVDEPATLLGALAAQLEPGAPAFLSTVANMEAEDHVYLFRDAGEIRSLLLGSGFEIESDQPLELAGSQGGGPTPLNYSAVVRVSPGPSRDM